MEFIVALILAFFTHTTDINNASGKIKIDNTGGIVKIDNTGGLIKIDNTGGIN